MRRKRKSLITSYKEYLNVITGKDSNLFQSVSIYNLKLYRDRVFFLYALGMEGATGLMNFS